VRPDRARQQHRSYQPIEREWKVTRSILEVLAGHEHPFSIVTKSALVERDIDLIAPMAAKNMARVCTSPSRRSIATSRAPRATRRGAASGGSQAMRALHDAAFRGRAGGAGHSAAQRQGTWRRSSRRGRRGARRGLDHAALCRSRSRLSLRLAGRALPLRAAHIMSLVQQLRGGRDYDQHVR
jgi:hypothetical protein